MSSLELFIMYKEGPLGIHPGTGTVRGDSIAARYESVIAAVGAPFVDLQQGKHFSSYFDNSDDRYAPLNLAPSWEDESIDGLEPIKKPHNEQIRKDLRKDIAQNMGILLSDITLIPVVKESADGASEVTGVEASVYLIKELPSVVVKIKNGAPDLEHIEAMKPINTIYRILLKNKGFEDSIPKLHISTSHIIEGEETATYAVQVQERVFIPPFQLDVLQGIFDNEILLKRFGGDNGAYNAITRSGIPMDGDYRKDNYGLFLRLPEKEEGKPRRVIATEAFYDGLTMTINEVLMTGFQLRVTKLLIESHASNADRLKIGVCVQQLLKIKRKFAKTPKEIEKINATIENLKIADDISPIPVYQRTSQENYRESA